MLLSERQERERRFKLALRAGIPVVLLISLVLYSTFFKDDAIEITMENAFLVSALLFITIYFIYFLMDLSVKETLIDQATQGYNEKAFIAQLEAYKPKTLVLLIIKNLSTISENYSTDDVDLLLYSIIHKLDNALNKAGFNHSLIARRYGAEFLVAIDKSSDDIQRVFDDFVNDHKIINDIERNYNFAVITNTGEELQKDILDLKDLISTQYRTSDKEKKSNVIKDAKEISETETAIINALKEKNLLLTFRPLLSIKNNVIDIYEISVKLRSGTIGNILPRVYLPVVNRLGLGREYDLALVKHVIDLLPLVDENISLSFNLSPFSLRDEKFQEKFFNYLEQSKVDPSRLIIELYERKTHHDLSGYLKTLNKFRAKGIRIAIDNFGSSNASMEYMKHFKFDLVQFDRDYVTKLNDANTEAMLGSMIKMSKDLHITTVAKWVDNDTQKSK
ncbi:MAG TPA: EAL domain-containing protein, partial [Epsilonproteobacteria bacterium]|nr:EAL domain-containing protein [Campylobacterota bacterium]